MGVPRAAVNGATTSVGFTVKLVTVQSVSPDGKTATCIDRQNTQVRVPMMIQRSKGLLPAPGETWLVTQDLGQWTFSAIVAQSAAQFQALTGSQGVYVQATAPPDPVQGEIWINTSLDNIISFWNGTSWIVTQLGAAAIQPGSLTSAQLAAEAGIVASQVNFTISDIGGITTTISATAPPGPSFGDLWYDAGNGYQLKQWSGTEWVPYQFGTQAIAARAVTTELLAAEAVTAAEIAAGTIFGGIIDGTIVNAAVFVGSVFEGTDFVINEFGAFFYSGTPAAGNLIASVANAPGNDASWTSGAGNSYVAGVVSYGSGGQLTRLAGGAVELNAAGTAYIAEVVAGVTGSAGAVQVASTFDVIQFDMPVDDIFAQNPSSAGASMEGWHAMTLINGWTAGSGVTPKYRKVSCPPGTVDIVGSVNGSVASSAVFAQLPVGYKPNTGQRFNCQPTTLTATGQYYGTAGGTTGNLSVTGGTLTFNYNFDGLIRLDA